MYHNDIGAINLAHNAKLSEMTKHVDAKYYSVKEYIEKDIIFVRSEENTSDILTKNTKVSTFMLHSSKFMDNII